MLVEARCCSPGGLAAAVVLGGGTWKLDLVEVTIKGRSRGKSRSLDEGGGNREAMLLVELPFSRVY